MRHLDIIRKKVGTSKVGGIIAIIGSVIQITFGIVLLGIWKYTDPDHFMFANASVYLLIMGLLALFTGMYGLQHGIEEVRNHANRAILELADEMERIKNQHVK